VTYWAFTVFFKIMTTFMAFVAMAIAFMMAFRAFMRKFVMAFGTTVMFTLRARITHVNSLPKKLTRFLLYVGKTVSVPVLVPPAI
jgi:hypothetical protein